MPGVWGDSNDHRKDTVVVLSSLMFNYWSNRTSPTRKRSYPTTWVENDKNIWKRLRIYHGKSPKGLWITACRVIILPTNDTSFLNLSKYVSVYEHLCSALSNVGGKKENISFIDQHEMCEIWWSSIITFRIKVFMLLILTSIINFHPFMIQKQHYFKHTDQKMYNHSLLP